MKIDIVCDSGSPIGVVYADIYGENGRIGVGGAELALFTICEELGKVGHTVTLYNNPKGSQTSPHFTQRNIDEFKSGSVRDVVIAFRIVPKKLLDHSGIVGYKIFWSCDQYTQGDFKVFAKWADKVVCISPRHQEYFESFYGIKNSVWIDLPVRVQDYSTEFNKVKNSSLFASIPDRGLDVLAAIYPNLQKRVPDISLTITSDYCLWGNDAPLNEKFRVSFLGREGVYFRGAIPRRELVKEQMKAQYLLYPCTYDELFCYTVAEAEVAGCYVITSDMGSLPTTNFTGKIIPGDPKDFAWMHNFVGQVSDIMNGNIIIPSPQEISKAARERFLPDKILQQWNDKIFKGI